LAEELPIHLGALARQVADGESVPSLGLTAEVELADPSRRAAFLRDVEASIRAIAARYGRTGPAPVGADRAGYRLLVACYPRPDIDVAPGAPRHKGGEA